MFSLAQISIYINYHFNLRPFLIRSYMKAALFTIMQPRLEPICLHYWQTGSLGYCLSNQLLVVYIQP